MLIKRISQSIFYKSTLIFVSIAFAVTIFANNYSFAQEKKIEKYQLGESTGYYYNYKKEFLLVKPNLMYLSHNKIVFSAISESFGFSVLEGLVWGSLAALLAKNKKEAFRNWSIGAFAFSFPIVSYNSLTNIDKKKIVKYKNNWIVPERFGLMKTGDFWVLKKDLHSFFWEEAQKNDNVQSYENYLKYYPLGIYGNDAKQRLELLHWEKAEQENDYEDFLKRYPQGKFAAKAKQRISLSDQDKKDNNKLIKSHTTLIVGKFDQKNAEYDDSYLNLRIPRQLIVTLREKHADLFDKIIFSSGDIILNIPTSGIVYALGGTLTDFSSKDSGPSFKKKNISIQFYIKDFQKNMILQKGMIEVNLKELYQDVNSKLIPYIISTCK